MGIECVFPTTRNRDSCIVPSPKTCIVILPLVLLLVSDRCAGELTGKRLATRLVSQLGHEQFAKREQASVKLIELGIVAADALRAGKSSASREIRYRSTKLYSLISEADFQRRLDAFDQSDDPSQGYGLPGWDRYRQEVGTDTNARALFMSMQEQERELLEALAGDGRIQDEFARYCQALEKRYFVGQRPSNSAQIATLLFVSNDRRITITDTIRRIVFNSCKDRDFVETINEGKSRPPLAKLVGNWIDRDAEHEVWNVLYLGLITNVDICLPHARQVLREPQDNVDKKMCALLCMAKFGKSNDIPLLETLLKSKTVYAQSQIANQVVETQFRDVALAALLKITGQKPLDYGFDRMQPHRYEVFHPRSLGFRSEEKRLAAIAAWRKYRRDSADKE